MCYPCAYFAAELDAADPPVVRPSHPFPPGARTQGYLARALSHTDQALRRAAQRAERLAAELSPRRASSKAVASDGGTAVSGWRVLAPDVPTTAEEVRAVADVIGHRLVAGGPRDQLAQGGWPGKYVAAHAEKKLSVAYPDEPIAVNKPMCPDCRVFFATLARMRGRVQVVRDLDAVHVFLPNGEHRRVAGGQSP